MLDLADSSSLSNRFWSAGVPGVLRKNIPLILRDGDYSHKAWFALVKARFVDKLHGENHFFKKIVRDVVEEITEIAKQGTISHLVIYGQNRIQVMTTVLCHGSITGNLPILLSEKAMEKEVLIAERIGNKLSPDDIRSLPDVLDFPCNPALGVPAGLLEKLYVSGRLIQPYQIDTDRYPFSRKYI